MREKYTHGWVVAWKRDEGHFGYMRGKAKSSEQAVSDMDNFTEEYIKGTCKTEPAMIQFGTIESLSHFDQEMCEYCDDKSCYGDDECESDFYEDDSCDMCFSDDCECHFFDEDDE